jgi:hypothetical protein
MPTPTMILTIAPDRGGKTAMWVSLRAADGTQAPPQAVAVDQDYRLASFVAAMQAIARQQLTPIESPTIGRAGDGNPAIACDATHGEQGR